MKTIHKTPAMMLLTALLALTTTAAMAAGAAGAVGSTVNTATGAVNGTVQGAVGAGSANPASAMGASSFGSGATSGAAGATVDAAGNPIKGNLNTGANGYESIGMQRERLQREAEAKNSAAVNANGSTVSGSTSANASFDAAPAARSIRAATIATRDQMESDVKASMNEGHRAISVAKTQAERLDDRARSDFKASVEQVSVREKQLKASMKAAGKATADNWEAARAQLASDQEAYAQAVAQAQAQAAQASVSGTVEGGKR